MAITFVTIPGGTAYGNSTHYAAFADSPLKVTSDEGDEDNFLFKVEILDGSLVSLITCYFPPTSIVTGTATLETSLGDIVKNLIDVVEPISADQAYRTNNTAGYLYHKIKVTEVYDDVNGVPTEDETATTPAGGDFYVAHNIAHEGDPGMNLGIYPNALLTNDVDGIFPIASHKQLSAWVDYGISESIGMKVVIASPYGNSVQYIKDSNGVIPITKPSHGRIVFPLNAQSLSISNKATSLTAYIAVIVAPDPPPGGIGITIIEEPPVTSPPGAGVKFTTASAHGFVAGDIVRVTNTVAGAFYYEGDYVVLYVPSTTTFYIKFTYDAGESTNEDYEVALAYNELDYVGESEPLPYSVTYAIKQTGCYVPLIYANNRGGFDVVDFIAEDSVSVNAARDRMKLGGLKRSFGTVTAARRELSTGWIKENDFELMQGFIASNRHWKVDANGDPSEVLLLTDSAKLTERRDVVNVQVVIEDQDLQTNE
jgi:hypothetical protein